MTLSCYELSAPLEIADDRISTIIIENHAFYRNFIEDLLLQSQNGCSRFVLADENNILNLSKEAEILTDIFCLPFDSRTMQNKVNQLALQECNLSARDAPGLLSKINEMAAEIVCSLDFEAGYTPLADLSGVIKLLGFFMEAEGLTFPERIIEYINFLSRYCKKKLFIILNLKCALTAEEYSEFAKLICYKRINVLLVESGQSENTAENETVRIIDKDLCEI